VGLSDRRILLICHFCSAVSHCILPLKPLEQSEKQKIATAFDDS